MKRKDIIEEHFEVERYEMYEAPPYQFDLSRRGFVQILGAGLVVSMSGDLAFANGLPETVQSRSTTIGERLHIGTDGIITVMTGKVEVGQGSKTQIAQAAAEELRVSIDTIRMIMADTDLVPNDGGTFGSRTTPSTIPAVRRACSSARDLLIDLAAKKWNTDPQNLSASDGAVVDSRSDNKIAYADLAKDETLTKSFEKTVENRTALTPVAEWKVMGTLVSKVDGRSIVDGTHKYPADIVLPGMLYGKELRPPSYTASLVSVDLEPAKKLDGVIAVKDGNFVGVAAPTSHLAEQAIEAIAKTARWKADPHPSSRNLFSYLKENVSSGGGRGFRRRGSQSVGSVIQGLEDADKTFRESYTVAYIQHVPMEPRAAVAQWENGKVTAWTGTQQPFRVKSDIARAMQISDERVRLIVPDTGGGFGGKHTSEVAIQAVRLSREAGKPVSVLWTREEEFTWAYFRPAGLIEIQGGLDSKGNIKAWEFINYNSGFSALATPYAIPNITTTFKACDSPLREGSYRGLAATANTFARESFMDELSAGAGADPLEFRLDHLQNERLKNVLEAAAERFGWNKLKERKSDNRGIGLSCGIEKGSYTAACADVEVDRKTGSIHIIKFVQSFECGAIINPDNLRAQVDGSIVMALGGALWEEIEFENGKILNASLRDYRVPRFNDIPDIETILIDRPDLSSVGAGETPIIAAAPAIGNAVFAATGVRLRSMPLKGSELKQGN